MALKAMGVNRNQGAESSLAYLISHLIVLEAFEEFEQKDLVKWQLKQQ